MADLVEKTGGRIISTGADVDVENLYPYVATTDALENKEEAIGKVIQAVADNIAWIQENPDEQATLLAPKLGFSESAIKSTYSRGATALQPIDDTFYSGEQGVIDELKEAGIVTQAGAGPGRLRAGLQRPDHARGMSSRRRGGVDLSVAVPGRRDRLRRGGGRRGRGVRRRDPARRRRPRPRRRACRSRSCASSRATGLLGIRVPARLGGAGVSSATVAEVFRLIAVADPAVAQIPQNHVCFVDTVIRYGSAEQRELFLPRVPARRAPRQRALRARRRRRRATGSRDSRADGDGGVPARRPQVLRDGRAHGAVDPRVRARRRRARRRRVRPARRAGRARRPGLDTPSASARRSAAPSMLDGRAASGGMGDPRRRSARATPTTFGAFGQLMHAAIDVGHRPRGPRGRRGVPAHAGPPVVRGRRGAGGGRPAPAPARRRLDVQVRARRGAAGRGAARALDAADAAPGDAERPRRRGWRSRRRRR